MNIRIPFHFLRIHFRVLLVYKLRFLRIHCGTIHVSERRLQSVISIEPKAISKRSEEFVKTINPIYIFQNTVAQAIPIVFTKIINSFISNSRFRSGARRDVVATIARRHWRTWLLVRVLCFGAGVSHKAWRQFSPLAESTACMGWREVESWDISTRNSLAY